MSEPIPAFRDDGYLPEGIHLCTEADATFRFGTQSRRRRRLIVRLRRWIALGRAIGATRLLVDGSFVTAKLEPDDIDAVMLVPSDFFLQLEQGLEAALELDQMFLTRQPEELFPAEDESIWQGWCEFFQPHTRTGQAPHRSCGDSIMISTLPEYEAAKEELSHLEDWLARLQRENPAPSKGLSKAGIRKMIARLHEELALYEGGQEVESAKR